MNIFLSQKLFKKTNNIGLYFVIPVVFYIFIIGIYPIIIVFKLSFETSSGISILNYLKILSDNKFWIATYQTLRYVFLAVPLHILIALILSSLLAHPCLSENIRNISRVLLMLPWTTTLVVAAIMWRLMLNPSFSMFSEILKNFGFSWNQSILTNPKIAFLAIVIAGIWVFTPFYMLMILARMQAIDNTLYEAAEVDGATGWQKFRVITIPELKQTLKFLIIYDIIGTAIQFDLVWLMTNGGPLGSTEVLATYSYRNAFEYFNMSYSATIGVMMVILIALISGTIIFFSKEEN